MILVYIWNEINRFEEGNQSLMGVLGTLEALWGCVEALGSTYIDPKAHLADCCNQSNGFRERHGSLLKHRGPFTSSPKLILADSCYEIIGFRARGWIQEGPKRDCGKRLNEINVFEGVNPSVRGPLGIFGSTLGVCGSNGEHLHGPQN